jgi:ABC-type molybdate transport system substrate-binding protein
MRIVPVLLLAACARDPSLPTPLAVGASPALKAVVEAAAAALKNKQSDFAPALVFGAPTELVNAGTPVDLLIGDASDVLVAVGGKPAWQREIASNPLCLVVRAGERNEARFKTLRNAGEFPLKVAMPDSRGEGPGAQVEAALGRLGLRRGIDAKLLYAGGGDDMLAKLSRGEVDAALAFAAQVTAWNTAHADTALRIADRADDARARILAAVPASSPRAVFARRFAEELSGPEARRAFEERGLAVTP